VVPWIFTPYSPRGGQKYFSPLRLLLVTADKIRLEQTPPGKSKILQPATFEAFTVVLLTMEVDWTTRKVVIDMQKL
jgi:hypothetical protein